MENDLIEKLVNTKYFKLDFSKQKIEGNKDFEEFKNKQIIELGNDAKLFHCKKDNTYFYISKTECKARPYYFKKCPLCNNNICYFCKRNAIIPSGQEENCCIKSKFYNLFFYKGFQQLKEEGERKWFYVFLILNILPGFGSFLICLLIMFCLFYNLLLIENKKWKGDTNRLFEKTYNFYLKEYYHYNIILIIFIFSEIFFAICFWVYYFYFIIIILIISLFTKFYPLEYLISFIVSGIE